MANIIKQNSDYQKLESSVTSQNVPEIVLNTLSLALEIGVSDVHIQPEDEKVYIRFRIDGVMHDVITYATMVHPAICSRIKIISNLKIDETRIPQDGHAQVTTVDGKSMDLRVSTLPTIKGEKIVMRLVDRSKDIPTLESLGLSEYNLKLLKEALKNPNGVILTSGPTGSGKTTTLYSALNYLNDGKNNILTIEDPVEIPLKGTSQAQTKKEIGFDFAKGLRAALRQDPDIIMVGEVRDQETLNTAIEASLTGHLVFSTIHTNSAIETISRMINMGVPRYLLASSIRCVIAQRLVRKVNPDAVEYKQNPAQVEDYIKANLKEAPEQFLKDVDLADLKIPHLKEGLTDLDKFKGRVPLYEILIFTEEFKNALVSGEPISVLRKIAKKNGMVTLLQSGLRSVLQSKTTLSEILRIVNS